MSDEDAFKEAHTKTAELFKIQDENGVGDMPMPFKGFAPGELVPDYAVDPVTGITARRKEMGLGVNIPRKPRE